MHNHPTATEPQETADAVGGRKRVIIILGTIAVAASTYAVTRSTAGEMGARALAILVASAVLWATEALPLFATSFVVIGLEILTLADEGGLADQITSLLAALGIPIYPSPAARPMSAATFLRPFSQDIVILFMGGFLISAAMTKHGVGRILAAWFLHRFTHSPVRLLYAVLAMSAFFSMWMSNTATSAMMIAVTAPLLAAIPSADRFRSGLLLAVAFGANLGGLATPIGTPPNAIAYGALNAAGYQISFLRWMMVVVPLQLLTLAGTGWLLYFFFRPRPELTIPALSTPETMTIRGKITLGVLALTVALWLTNAWHGLTPGAVALLAAGALTAIGVLDDKDIGSIDWSILVLMWGGLSLGVALQESGLASYLAQADFASTIPQSWGLALFTVVVSMLMSTFMSNTATAALLVPMALALPAPENREVAMLAALACSFGMALPISTPPNLVVYSTGTITSQEMRRSGAIVAVAGAVLLLLGFRIMLPLAF